MWKYGAGFAVLCGAIVVILVGYQFFAPPPPPPPPPPKIVDQLCKFVTEEQHMSCVNVLAADTFMKPGAIVEYEPKPDGTARVSLPVSDLFASDLFGKPSCLVPGVDLASIKKRLSQPQPISIPHLSYEVNRNLNVGADVEVPKMAGFSLKAGPKWSDVGKIELANDDAWAIQLDELSAISAYKSCHILKKCAEYIAASDYRVVGTAIVAKGTNYSVYDKRGDLISLQAGVSSGTFSASVGGSTDLTATGDSTIKSPGNRVVGVRLMPTSTFTGQQTCGEPIAFDPPVATSSVSIVGGGERGNIGALQNQAKPIGELAKISAMGKEESECRPDLKRIISGANAEARVDEDGPGAVRFSYKISAQGGHYETVATCPLGQPVGTTPHDTTATAEAELTATIYVIVRSERPPPLRVSYSNMPEGTNIRLVDWHNQPIKIMKRTFVNGDTVRRFESAPNAVKGSDSELFEATSGPGYYRVEARFHLSASKSGNSSGAQSETASLRVTLEQ